MDYRKRPVVIQAVQHRAGEIAGELAAHIAAGRIQHTVDDTLLIDTLEGVMEAQPGDWIITGVKGELYPCKPDIFALTYEAVEDDAAGGPYEATGEQAYFFYGEVTDFKNFRGDPMPAWAELPEKIQEAWARVARKMKLADFHRRHLVYADPTAESRGLRQQLDEVLQLVKSPVSGRKSRSRSIAITAIEDAILRLGMDLKEQREEGLDVGPSPYPDSYDATSSAPIAPTADGLTL